MLQFKFSKHNWDPFRKYMWICDVPKDPQDYAKIGIASLLQFKTYPEPSVEIPPTAVLNPSDIQQLMDDLWRDGIRPTEVKTAPGEIIRLENHLADMRKIVFKE